MSQGRWGFCWPREMREKKNGASRKQGISYRDIQTFESHIKYIVTNNHKKIS